MLSQVNLLKMKFKLNLLRHLTSITKLQTLAQIRWHQKSLLIITHIFLLPLIRMHSLSWCLVICGHLVGLMQLQCHLQVQAKRLLMLMREKHIVMITIEICLELTLKLHSTRINKLTGNPLKAIIIMHLTQSSTYQQLVEVIWQAQVHPNHEWHGQKMLIGWPLQTTKASNTQMIS